MAPVGASNAKQIELVDLKPNMGRSHEAVPAERQ